MKKFFRDLFYSDLSELHRLRLERMKLLRDEELSILNKYGDDQLVSEITEIDAIKLDLLRIKMTLTSNGIG